MQTQYLPPNKFNNEIIGVVVGVIIELIIGFCNFLKLQNSSIFKYLTTFLFCLPPPIFCFAKNFVTPLSQHPTEWSVLETGVTNRWRRIVSKKSKCCESNFKRRGGENEV